MAPETTPAEWLEQLTPDEHMALFRPPAGWAPGLFSIKKDHETSDKGVCWACKDSHSVEVIE